jgi:predicted transcriptional regulator
MAETYPAAVERLERLRVEHESEIARLREEVERLKEAGETSRTARRDLMEQNGELVAALRDALDEMPFDVDTRDWRNVLSKHDKGGDQ